MFEDNKSCSREDGTQYCNQFLHDLNFEDFFSTQCMGKSSCQLSEVNKFIDTSVDKNFV
jgi:hypothetical protein